MKMLIAGVGLIVLGGYTGTLISKVDHVHRKVEIADLQAENMILRHIVETEIPATGEKIRQVEEKYANCLDLQEQLGLIAAGGE